LRNFHNDFVALSIPGLSDAFRLKSKSKWNDVDAGLAACNVCSTEKPCYNRLVGSFAYIACQTQLHTMRFVLQRRDEDTCHRRHRRRCANEENPCESTADAPGANLWDIDMTLNKRCQLENEETDINASITAGIVSVLRSR
jgi:hypothetical protein